MVRQRERGREFKERESKRVGELKLMESKKFLNFQNSKTTEIE